MPAVTGQLAQLYLALGDPWADHSPLEKEEVQVVVFLGEEVAEDAGGIATADLVGGQGEVDALHEVPQLGHSVLAEHPGMGGGDRRRRGWSLRSPRLTGLCHASCPHPRTKAPLPLGDGWQDEEHPEVYGEHQHHLEGQLAQHSLAQVEGAVHDHGAELDQQHDQEGLGHLVV